MEVIEIKNKKNSGQWARKDVGIRRLILEAQYPTLRVFERADSGEEVINYQGRKGRREGGEG